MTCFTRVGILEDMIDMFGGMRFRCMDLRNVDGVQLLLDACAETLETLRLHPSDPDAKIPPQRFDLSRNKSLRTFEITMRSIWKNSGSTIDSSVMRAFSTIASPVFSRVTAFYLDDDFRGAFYGFQGSLAFYRLSATNAKQRVASQHRKVFEVLRRMRKVRDFRLELCADVWGCLVEQTVQELEWAIATEQKEGGLDDFSPRPLVTSNPREFLPALGEPTNSFQPFALWVHAWAPDYCSMIQGGTWPLGYHYQSL